MSETATIERSCEQCRRKGTRGFTVYPADPSNGTPELIVCTARTTCMRRAYRNIPRHQRGWQNHPDCY